MRNLIKLKAVTIPTPSVPLLSLILDRLCKLTVENEWIEFFARFYPAISVFKYGYSLYRGMGIIFEREHSVRFQTRPRLEDVDPSGKTSDVIVDNNKMNNAFGRWEMEEECLLRATSQPRQHVAVSFVTP